MIETVHDNVDDFVDVYYNGDDDDDRDSYMTRMITMTIHLIRTF